MGEIVLGTKQEFNSEDKKVDAEEMADYLLKNNYPAPTTDRDELVALIQKRAKELENES